MNLKKVLVRLNILNGFLISLLLIFTIFQIGTITNQICFINEAKRKIEKIEKEKNYLEGLFLGSVQLEKLETFLSEEKLVKAKKLKYIQIFEGTALAK